MSWALRRYVALLFVSLFVGIAFAVTAIFLGVDYGDQQRWLSELSPGDLLRLYLARSALAFKQLAPAAMLLSGGASFAIVRRRGEWVGLQSLGMSPTQTLAPLCVAALALCGALVLFDEVVGTRATAVASEYRQAAWQSNGMGPAEAPRWFSLGALRLHCRGGRGPVGIEEVTLWWLDEQFSVQRRVEARQLLPGATPTEWIAQTVTVHEYDGGQPTSVREAASLPLSLDARVADATEVTGRRPEALSLNELYTQQAVRRRLGMATEPLTLTAHLRFAYPAAGLTAALLAALLALRRARGSQLTYVLVDGVAICFVLVVILAAGRTLVMAGRVSPGSAAWAPVLCLAAASTAVWAGLRRPG